MESGDGNEFRESEWRRLLGLLDARRHPRPGVVIDLDVMRKKRAARVRDGSRPQLSGLGRTQPGREDE